MSEQLDAVLNVLDSRELADVLKEAGLPSAGSKPERLVRVKNAVLTGGIDFAQSIVRPCYKEALQAMCKASGLDPSGRVEDLSARINTWFDGVRRKFGRGAFEPPNIQSTVPSEIRPDEIAGAQRDMILVTSHVEDPESVVGFLKSAVRGAGRLLGATDALRITPRDAERLFQFDPGHPLDGHAYIRNPHLERHYLPPAQAADRIVRERMNAFLHICAALGARRVEIISVEALEAHDGVDLSAAAVQMNLVGHVTRTGEITRRVYMEWPAAGRAPIPEKFRPVLNANPDLRVLEEMAQAGRLPNSHYVHFEVRDSEEIALKISKIPWLSGVSLGGEMKRVDSNKWKFRVEFGPTTPRCRRCGAEIIPDVAFCGTCGTRAH